MERFPIPSGTKPDVEQFYLKILDGAQGNSIVFTSEPSLSDLQPNQIGKFDNNLYLKFSDGTGIKLTGAALS